MLSFTQIRPVQICFLLLCGLAAGLAQSPQGAPVSQNTARLAPNVIEGIEFRGLSRVSLDTLKAILVSKAGDIYDEKAVKGDFTALWNTHSFDDVQVKTQTGSRGGIIVRFTVTERQ
jgi:outer membrane protein assembly factor BamA